MGVSGEVIVKVGGQTAGLSNSLKSGGKELTDFVKKAEGQFKALTFQKGAGAFAGAFAGLAKGAEGLATAIRSGGSASEAFGKIVDGIPIVGQFKAAGESIREMITGEKQAREELEKNVAAADKLIASFREMARVRSTLGKYGDEKSLIENRNQGEREQERLNKEMQGLQASVSLRESKLNKAKQTLAGGGGDFDEVINATKVIAELGTQAQQDELLRDKRHLKDLQAQKDTAAAVTAQGEIDIQKGAAERQHQFLRDQDQEADAFAATSLEKSLRRQGKALESAIVGINADAAAKAKAIKDGVRDEVLDAQGLSPESRAERKAAADASLMRNESARRQTEADLREESARKEQEITADNEEKLKGIRAAAGIERLKMSDEQINAENEKRGVAARSHLADAATIEEEYRKQVADIEKNYREQNRTNTVDYDDNAVKGGLDAAAEQRKSALAHLDQRAGLETAKNEENHLKEMRKLWEEVGDPAEKYAAKLEDINEQFQKFGDKKLRDRELDKLDKATFDELKNLNPDHAPKVELYGRTMSYDGIAARGNTDLASQQLAEIKKQTTLQEDQRTALQTLATAASAPVTELDI